MAKTITTRYHVSEHLRTPEEMAAYLEACIEEANGDAALIAKALGDIAGAKGMPQLNTISRVSSTDLTPNNFISFLPWKVFLLLWGNIHRVNPSLADSFILISP